MNPHYYRDSEADPIAGSPPDENRSIRERRMHAADARPPPAISYRRYPSLSDDGQPWFPRLRRARRSADESAAANSANESDPSPFFSVRAFALLALVAIIAALVAGA